MNQHPILARVQTRLDEIDLQFFGLEVEARELETFKRVFNRFAHLDEVDPAEDPEATPQGSVSSPADETAATDPGDYEQLESCWRSGQISDADWLGRLNTDHKFRRWALQRVEARAQADKTESDAQPDGQALAAPVEPEATSPASAMEPHTCGSGEATHGVPTASPPHNGAADEAPTDPQPAAPDEAIADPANKGGDDAQVDNDSPISPEGPVSQEATPAPTVTEPAKPDLPGRQRQLLDAIMDHARDGVFDKTQAEITQLSGVPRSSITGTILELVKKGLISREPGGTIRLAEAVRRPRDQENTREERSGTSRKDSSTQGERDPEGSDVGVQPAAPHAEAPPRSEPSCPVGEGPPPKVAFDSKAPKPEWDFNNDRIIAGPLNTVGAPDGLAVAGHWLICGTHKIHLAKEQAIVMGRLVKDWGNGVPVFDLVEEIRSRSIVGNAKAAGEHVKVKRLSEINALLKPAGLMVLEDEGRWRLCRREEAGAVSA